MIVPSLVVLLGFVLALAAAGTDRLLETAGDSSKFVADPTIIVNNGPLPAIPTNVTAGVALNWVMYKQCDSHWASQELGTCSSQTICSAGCAMSSVAMMLATKGVSKNPGTLDSWLTQNGGYASGCNIVWAKADAFGKTTFQGIETANESEICNGLSKGHGIIANVNGGGHWVLLTGCKGNGVFTVNDPGFSKTTYTKSEILREAVYH